MQQTNQPNILSSTSVDGTTATPLPYAQAAASSSMFAPTGIDAPMQNVPIATGERKRRIVSAEERQELHACRVATSKILSRENGSLTGCTTPTRQYPRASSRVYTRAERCQGGPNGQGDGVFARYIVSGGARIGGTPRESAHDGERFFRLGDDYDPESDGIEGVQTLPTLHKLGDTARRNAQRKIAAQRAQRAAAAKLDPEALTAHTAALAKSFLPAGVCRKAAERLSTTDSPCYIPACNTERAAEALDTPAQYITAACNNSSCRTAMCISLNKTGEAVVHSLSETRVKAAASIATARMDTSPSLRSG